MLFEREVEGQGRVKLENESGEKENSRLRGFPLKHPLTVEKWLLKFPTSHLVVTISRKEEGVSVSVSLFKSPFSTPP